jgi:hypothetical protein
MNQREVPEYLKKRTYQNSDKALVKVETKTLISFFRSKEDIYKYFVE